MAVGEPLTCPACGEPLSEDRACWSCDWGPEPEGPDDRHRAVAADMEERGDR